MRLSGSVGFKRAGGGSTSGITPGIVMLWPNSASAPSGWVKCNGSNGTVDMRGYTPRGTPQSDTVNRVYGSAAHTHCAPHSHTGTSANHTHSLAQHCHTSNHYHTNACCHKHTVDCHTHGTNHDHVFSHSHDYYSDHCHQVIEHSHLQYHIHGPVNASYSSLYVEAFGGYQHATTPFYGITDPYSNPPQIPTCDASAGGYNQFILHYGNVYLTGDTGDVQSPNEYTGTCAPYTSNYAGYLGTDSCSPTTLTPHSCATSSDGSDTGYTELPDTEYSEPSTNTAGAVATGAAGPAAILSSCSLTTASGDGTPPTRNVEYIMKL